MAAPFPRDCCTLHILTPPLSRTRHTYRAHETTWIDREREKTVQRARGQYRTRHYYCVCAGVSVCVPRALVGKERERGRKNHISAHYLCVCYSGCAMCVTGMCATPGFSPFDVWVVPLQR